MSRLYTTRNDALRAASEQMPDASGALIQLVTDQAWRMQQTIENALIDLMARGIDTEGY